MSKRKALTIVLLVQTLEDQSQFLLVVLEIVNKLLKIQLSIQVLVSSLHNFLFRRQKPKTISSFVCSDLPLLAPYPNTICHMTLAFPPQKAADRIMKVPQRNLSKASKSHLLPGNPLPKLVTQTKCLMLLLGILCYYQVSHLSPTS